MLSVALRTLRARWTTFAGSFVALALGVGLIATTGLALASSLDAPERRPERFAAARTVVRGPDTLRVPTPHGPRTKELDRPRSLAPSLTRELAALGRTVEDRAFAVRAGGGPDGLVGHPWSTAAFAPYRLDSGRPPRSPDEVVATGSWATPGLRTATDRGPVTVVGTVRDLGFERALFFTDARAAALAPPVTQLVVDAPAGAVRAAVADTPGVHVLSGRALSRADADPDRENEALVAVNAMLGTAAGITGFVSVFVVASTFAFAVAQRRREFGLLRTAGATPGQIRRTVVAEAMAVGTMASATGCVLGAEGAPRLAAWLVNSGAAPAWFTVGSHTWPYHLAFWTGLSVALAGVLAASWRAGRVGPAEALRDASVDSAVMTRGRWALGGGVLLTGLGLLAFTLLTEPATLLGRKSYISRPMLLIVAFALLAPAVVRPVTRVLAWAPARLRGATGTLVRESASAGLRRTAAVAAPVLVTVALAGSLLGAASTVTEAKAGQVRARTAADLVVTGPEGTGFDAATLARMRRIPGAVISPTASDAVYVLEDGVALIRSDARAGEPGPLAATLQLPLVAGRVRDLDDRSIIVNDEWERHRVGESVTVWRGDGTRTSLRIAAVMRAGTGDNGVYVTPRNAVGAPVDRVEVKVARGTDPRAVAGALRAAGGGRVLTAAEWADAGTGGAGARRTRAGLLMILGLALLYSGIALASTLVTATADRVRDLAVLRLAGATKAQVLRLVAAEAVTVVVVGAVLGVLVAGVGLLGLWGALRVLRVPSSLVMPWDTLGAVVAACAVTAVVAAVVPAWISLRRRPVEVAGARE